MSQTPGGAAEHRSYVRIKALVLFSIFLGCSISLLVLPYWNQNLLFSLAAISAVLTFFVRCERCHSSIYYRAGGRRVLFHGASTLRTLLGKRCPSCGLERI
jgi:hypothetical protein